MSERQKLCALPALAGFQKTRCWFLLWALLGATSGGCHEADASSSQPSSPQPFPAVLRQLQRPDISASVRRMDGTLLFEHQADVPRVPASVLKLLTVGAAIDVLGPSHSFTTDVFLRGDTLYIKGYGDPVLVSEQWEQLIGALPPDLRFHHLVLDGSYFADDLGIVQEPEVYAPYNARNGAFATNFNTISLSVEGDRVIGEAQTPWLDFVEVRRHPGPVVTVLGRSERFWDKLLLELVHPPFLTAYTIRLHLGFDPATPALYAGGLFTAIARKRGRSWQVDTITVGTVPADATLVRRYRNTQPLQQVIRQLLKYSNNFVANQLILAAGAHAEGPPATLAKGMRVLRRYANAMGVGGMRLFEASGLDPANRTTASQWSTYLLAQREEAATFSTLMQPISGGRARAKSGTFPDDGVRNLAGYVLRAGVPRIAFAFCCNGPGCGQELTTLYEAAIAAIAATYL